VFGVLLQLPGADGCLWDPLHRWEDVAGSKVRPSDVVKMAWGLARLRMKYFAREPWMPKGSGDGVL